MRILVCLLTLHLHMLPLASGAAEEARARVANQDEQTQNLATTDGTAAVSDAVDSGKPTPDTSIHEPESQIHKACRLANPEMLKEAISAGMSVHTVDDSGETPIFKLVSPFPSTGRISGNAIGFAEQDPHEPSAQRDPGACLKLLLDSKTNIRQVDAAGRTPLHVLSYDPALVAILINAGADPNVRDKTARTALHYAAGSNVIVELPPTGNSSRDTKFLKFEEPVETVRILLAARGDYSAIDDMGQTPLHIAAQHNHIRTMFLLLDAGASVNAQDNDGNTAVHCWLRSDDAETLSKFLERGADPRIANARGRTMLHNAVEAGLLEVTRLLLKNGADPRIKDKNGVSPTDEAKRGVNKYVYKLIRESGRK